MSARRPVPDAAPEGEGQRQYDPKKVAQSHADRQAVMDGGLFPAVDVDDRPIEAETCGSCGVFPAPAGAICSACAAVPGNGHELELEHIGSILPRVMADLLTRTTAEVLI